MASRASSLIQPRWAACPSARMICSSRSWCVRGAPRAVASPVSRSPARRVSMVRITEHDESASAAEEGASARRDGDDAAPRGGGSSGASAGASVARPAPASAAPRSDDAEAHKARGNAAFGDLFAYISGNNAARAEIEMTAPVLEGRILSMTAPVTEIADRNARTMQFFLPRGFETANAPKPTNPAVTLEDVPPAYYAAIIYSGFSSDRNFQKHHKLLKAALSRDGLEIIGAPIKATYDAPYTPPFLRRNEALFRLVWK